MLLEAPMLKRCAAWTSKREQEGRSTSAVDLRGVREAQDARQLERLDDPIGRLPGQRSLRLLETVGQHIDVPPMARRELTDQRTVGLPKLSVVDEVELVARAGTPWLLDQPRRLFRVGFPDRGDLAFLHDVRGRIVQFFGLRPAFSAAIEGD